MKEDFIWIDLIRIAENMLYLCIERIFGLTSGCRLLERNVCKLATMIVACSIGRDGNHLKEREY